MSHSDDRTIIYAMVYWVGGTLRWVLTRQRQPYLAFIQNEFEVAKNFKWGFVSFFALVTMFTLFQFFHFTSF